MDWLVLAPDGSLLFRLPAHLTQREAAQAAFAEIRKCHGLVRIPRGSRFVRAKPGEPDPPRWDWLAGPPPAVPPRELPLRWWQVRLLDGTIYRVLARGKCAARRAAEALHGRQLPHDTVTSLARDQNPEGQAA